MKSRTSLSLAVLATLTTVLLSGCVAYDGTPTATQTGEVGTTIHIHAVACANGQDVDTDGGSCAPANANGSPQPMRYAIAVLVPSGATTPSTAVVTLSSPHNIRRESGDVSDTTVHLIRDDVYTADLQQASPPPAGASWAGYVSETVNYETGDTSRGTFDLDVSLPTDGLQQPAASSAPWRISARAEPPTNTEFQPSTETTFDNTLHDDCYRDDDHDGTYEVNECLGAMYPQDGAGSTSLRRVLANPPAPVTVDAGSTATATGSLVVSGGELASPDVTVGVMSSAPGVSAQAPVQVSATSAATAQIPVTITAASTVTVTSALITVTATTSAGTVRTFQIPVTIRRDTAAPKLTITAKRAKIAPTTFTLHGLATDTGTPTSGVASVQVQVLRVLGKGKCSAWTGSKFFIETCAKATAHWVNVVLPKGGSTAKRAWTVPVTHLPFARWSARARTFDAAGNASKAATTSFRVSRPATRRH